MGGRIPEMIVFFGVVALAVIVVIKNRKSNRGKAESRKGSQDQLGFNTRPHLDSVSAQAPTESKHRSPEPLPEFRATEIVHSDFAGDLYCPKCGKKNASTQWPLRGDFVPYFSQLEHPQTFNISINCPHCHIEWYVVWDGYPGPIGRVLLQQSAVGGYKSTFASQDSSVPATASSPSGGEELLKRTLARVEAHLLAKADPTLPIVRLRLQETALGKQIVWCYRVSYDGPDLDSDAAERLLVGKLKPLGFKPLSAGYMGGGRGHEGEGNQVYNYLETSPRYSDYEAEVEELEKLDRAVALERAADLAKNGQFDLLIAWLREGKTSWIASEVLRGCYSQQVVQALVEMLRDSSLEVRKRAANALGSGHQQAAEALCSALKKATDYFEISHMAEALGRLACAAAKADLIEAARRVPKTRGLGVRATPHSINIHASVNA